jgi:hypothetical protein
MPPQTPADTPKSMTTEELEKVAAALADMRVGGYFDPKDGEDALGYAETLLTEVRELRDQLLDARRDAFRNAAKLLEVQTRELERQQEILARLQQLETDLNSLRGNARE